MQEILRLRFIERDKVFTQALTSIKNEMNARGMFHSGVTMKRGYDELVKELAESRRTILVTISENINISRPNKIDKTLTDNAVEWLKNRKLFLESFYLEQMNVIVASLQNKQMLEPYMNLSAEIELNEHELRRELAQETQRYINSRGTTLYDRIKNQFLDRPLVVIAVITIAAVTAILSFLARRSRSHRLRSWLRGRACSRSTPRCPSSR